jgi:hypothetical protein
MLGAIWCDEVTKLYYNKARGAILLVALEFFHFKVTLNSDDL